MAKGIIIEGDKEFKQILAQLPRRLENRVLRDVSRKGGRVILKSARKKVKIPGLLGKHFSSELLVRNDKENKSGVIVGVRVGRSARYFTNKFGKKYVPAPIGMHLTEGNKQNPRTTKATDKSAARYTGIAKKRYADPIEAAGNSDGAKAMDEMQKQVVSIIQKHIKKLAKK